MLIKWYQFAKNNLSTSFKDFATLSTVDEAGYPEGRIVLIRSVDARGLNFYTNYQSSKGQALAKNPKAGITFYWDEFKRQLRVVGAVEKLSAEESDAYWSKRAFESRLSAYYSKQSQELTDREEYSKLLKSPPHELPRPENWGGYRVIPKKIEFWAEVAFRRHERAQYNLQKDGSWIKQRLYP